MLVCCLTWQGDISGGYEPEAAGTGVHGLPHYHLHPWSSLRQCHLHVSGMLPKVAHFFGIGMHTLAFGLRATRAACCFATMH